MQQIPPLGFLDGGMDPQQASQQAFMANQFSSGMYGPNGEMMQLVGLPSNMRDSMPWMRPQGNQMMPLQQPNQCMAEQMTPTNSQVGYNAQPRGRAVRLLSPPNMNQQPADFNFMGMAGGQQMMGFPQPQPNLQQQFMQQQTPFLQQPAGQLRPPGLQFLWPGSIRPDMMNPNQGMPFAMNPHQARMFGPMGQFGPSPGNSGMFPVGNASMKGRVSQLSQMTTLPNNRFIGRQRPGSGFMGPRQFTSTRTEPAEIDGTPWTRRDPPPRDFPTFYSIQQSKASKDAPTTNVQFFEILLKTMLDDSVEMSIRRRLDVPVRYRALMGEEFATQKDESYSRMFDVEVPRPVGCEPGSPSRSSKSPVTASSVEDSPMGEVDEILASQPKDSPETQPSRVELPTDTLISFPISQVDSLAPAPPISQSFTADSLQVSSPPSEFHSSSFHGAAMADHPRVAIEYPNDLLSDFDSPTGLSVLAAVFNFLDASSLSKCELLCAGVRRLIRFDLPELWATASCHEDEDVDALFVDPPPPLKWIAKKSGFSEFHKVCWLERQAALQALAYTERLSELTAKRRLESLRSEQAQQMRKTGHIQSDLKTIAKSVQKIRRALRALQACHASHSVEYWYISVVLSKPWASVDLSASMRR